MVNDKETVAIDISLWAHVMNVLEKENVRPSTHSTSRSFSAIQAKLQEMDKNKLNKILEDYEEKHSI